MKQIYLDMDGVLADFSKKKWQVFGEASLSWGDGSAGHHKEMWQYIWKHFPNWFGDLEPMEDMKLLWEYTRPMKPIILTAASRVNVYETVKQKTTWVHKYLGPEVPVIVCMRSHKKDYANTDAILIDDHEDNIENFKKHGGIGILHTAAWKSIAALEGCL